MLSYFTFTLLTLKTKPSLKVGTANAICWKFLGLFRDYGLDNIFFLGLKLFFFFKIKSSNFQYLLDKEFRKTSQNFNSMDRKNGNKHCLNELNEFNELKFCEVSRNSFSKRCWKFQLSILKDKKREFQQMVLCCPNFHWRFWLKYHWFSRIPSRSWIN